MGAQRQILGVEAALRLAAFKLVRRGGAVVGLDELRNAAKSPERGLHAGLERERRFGATRDRPLAIGERQDPVGEEMIERRAGNRDAECVGVRPIELQSLAWGHAEGVTPSCPCLWAAVDSHNCGLASQKYNQ